MGRFVAAMWQPYCGWRGRASPPAADETGTLAQLQTLLREVVSPAVAGQDGRIFKEMGEFLPAFVG